MVTGKQNGELHAGSPFCVARLRSRRRSGVSELERIFGPLAQAGQRPTHPHAGVGLGAAIRRDLACGMGGDLTVESTPGVGSRFTLTLPAA